MIQINLLPEIKKEYIKVRRTKRLILTVSLLSSATIILVTALVFSYVQIAQKQHIDNLTEDIQSAASEVRQNPNLTDTLTLQNQLAVLPALHEQKPLTSRMFDYLVFLTPSTVEVTEMKLNVSTTTLQITGKAESIAQVNLLADNFKQVRYTLVIDGDESMQQELPPFTSVVATISGDNETATYSLSMQFDPTVFDNTQELEISLAGKSLSTIPATSDADNDAETNNQPFGGGE